MKMFRIVIMIFVSAFISQTLFISESFSGGSSNKPPILEFSSDKSEITPGESVTFTWSSTLADTCTIGPDLQQSSACSGSETISPVSTKTYEFSASNDDGDTSATVTVIVNIPPDSDNDGVIDSADNCADTPAGEPVDENGCSDSQIDTDGDGQNNNVDTDDDGDGMPDDWEAQYSSAPCSLDPLNSNDSGDDCDGDSFSNLVEYKFGSDPSDNLSIPLMEQVKIFDYDDVGRVESVVTEFK